MENNPPLKNNHRIEFRVNKDQKERIKLLAEASGLDISEYIRTKVLNGNSDDRIYEIYKKIVLEGKND